MSEKTIKVSLSGRIDKKGRFGDPQAEHYEEYFLALDLKNGQSCGDRYQKQLTINQLSMLVALSESRLGAQSPDNLRRLPVEIFTEWLIKVAKRLPTPERLIRGMEEANYQIWRGANETPQDSVLGASLAVALIEGNIAYVAQIGYVGAFVLRQGRIRRLPSQFANVQVISATETLPEDNEDLIVMPRELGSEKFMQIGVTAIELQHGDFLLLSTHGLYNYLQLSEILQLSIRNLSIDATTQQMATAARQRGSDHPFSLAMLQFTGEALTIQPGATQLTNCFQYFSRGEGDSPAVRETKELSSMSMRDSLTDLEAYVEDAGTEQLAPELRNNRDTIGIIEAKQEPDQYPRQEEINDGFVTCLAQLVQTEVLMQSQLEAVKRAIDWQKDRGMMDRQLFNSFIKLEIALKKIVEARALAEESQQNFSQR